MSKSYLKRSIETELERLAKLYPVVVVTGPRQSGKTTLCKKIFNNYHYANLEDIALREQILMSPKAFLSQHTQGILLDEVQLLPEIFSYIQVIVDEIPNAQCVLTGSSNFTLMEQVTQSLAGRSATLSLLPLSLHEIENSTGISTNRLILNGGFPAIWAKGIPTQDHSRNYYNTYIERDVRQLLKVKDLLKFQLFIRLCAGRIGTEFNATALANEVGVSAHTIIEWFSILEASYILFRLPPFFRNLGKRLVKSPKIYFSDTGLACFLLNIDSEEHLETHPLRGALFENMVVLEFLKHRYNRGHFSNLYFYRDKSQREIDLVQEFGNELYAYEIKSASSFHKDFFKHLVYLKELLGNDLVSMQVIYDGEHNTHSKDFGVINFRNIKFK